MLIKPFLTAAIALSFSASAVCAQTFKADVPDALLTPDTVETERLGTLRFFDGMPDDETVRKVYDNLNFSRGVEAFLSAMPAASIHALCSGYADAGFPAHTIGITEQVLDARSLWLTANSTTVYATTCLDLSEGPVVMEVPPGLLGFVNDPFFLWLTDVGITGPDQGRGGRYLFVPQDYAGPLPAAGYHIVHSTGYTHWFLGRGIIVDGDIKATVNSIKAELNVYPFAEASDPPEEVFVNYAGLKMNTIHSATFEYFEELDEYVQFEPDGAFPPEITGLLGSIGIRKGEVFAPDEQMKSILTDAASVGNATARAITYRPRFRDKSYFYEDREWYSSFAGGSHEFRDGGELVLEDRTMFHFGATGITPAMANPQVGTGSVYAFAAHSSDGAYLDGAKTYTVTLPAPIPAKDFWSFTVYSPQHRSMLETDQALAGLDSTLPDLAANADGSYTVWFGPSAPEGHEGNWVQTMPGQGFLVLLRLYGPLEPWFDASWKPGDFEEIE